MTKMCIYLTNGGCRARSRRIIAPRTENRRLDDSYRIFAVLRVNRPSWLGKIAARHVTIFTERLRTAAQPDTIPFFSAVTAVPLCEPYNPGNRRNRLAMPLEAMKQFIVTYHSCSLVKFASRLASWPAGRFLWSSAASGDLRTGCRQ